MAAPTFRPVVISGPSGSGKSTLVKRLMADHPGAFAFSVSHTTRAPRPGEAAGVDYHYVQRADMQAMIDAGEFVEHAEFSGNLYGTSYKAIKDVQASGRVCLLDVDIMGVKNIKKTDLNPRYLFIQPPPGPVLEQRLRGRGTETEEAVQKRLSRAAADIEYSQTGAYDRIIINDELDKAYDELKDMLAEEIASMKSAA